MPRADQCLLQDGFESATTGQIITRCVLLNCLPDSWKATMGGLQLTKEGVRDAQWKTVE